MSEALLRHLGGDEYEVASAGTTIASEVNSFALEVLKEKRILTEGLHPKTVDNFIDQFFDVIITVCDKAKQTCPYFHNTKEFLHWSIEDPAAFQGTYEEILFVFRETRDVIEEHIRE